MTLLDNIGLLCYCPMALIRSGRRTKWYNRAPMRGTKMIKIVQATLSLPSDGSLVRQSVNVQIQKMVASRASPSVPCQTSENRLNIVSPYLCGRCHYIPLKSRCVLGTFKECVPFCVTFGVKISCWVTECHNLFNS